MWLHPTSCGGAVTTAFEGLTLKRYCHQQEVGVAVENVVSLLPTQVWV